MRKAILSLFLLLAITLQCSGWGPTGHRVTGWIAHKYLNKKARRAVDKLLGGQSLAMASTWMDEVRSDPRYSHMTDWHWVTIPGGLSYDEAPKNPNGDIIKTLLRVIDELKTKNLAADKQAENIRILIHLVADIHQPLHVGARDDRGGNDIKVMWFSQPGNLHRVWDSSMIDDSRLSYTELAQSLARPPEPIMRAWQKASVYDWAAENKLLEDQVYNYGDGRLGYAYAYVNFPIVRERLLQAGVRLAGILNELFG